MSKREVVAMPARGQWRGPSKKRTRAYDMARIHVTAIHEAGHAVVSVMVDHWISGVKLTVGDEDTLGGTYRSRFEAESSDLDGQMAPEMAMRAHTRPWWRRATLAFLHDEAAVSLAGPVAEGVFCPDDCPDSADMDRWSDLVSLDDNPDWEKPWMIARRVAWAMRTGDMGGPTAVDEFGEIEFPPPDRAKAWSMLQLAWDKLLAFYATAWGAGAVRAVAAALEKKRDLDSRKLNAILDAVPGDRAAAWAVLQRYAVKPRGPGQPKRKSR